MKSHASCCVQRAAGVARQGHVRRYDRWGASFETTQRMMRSKGLRNLLQARRTRQLAWRRLAAFPEISFHTKSSQYDWSKVIKGSFALEKKCCDSIPYFFYILRIWTRAKLIMYLIWMRIIALYELWYSMYPNLLWRLNTNFYFSNHYFLGKPVYIDILTAYDSSDHVRLIYLTYTKNLFQPNLT